MDLSGDGLMFLVCEDVRREVSRKTTLVGVYTGRKIFIEQSVQAEGAPPTIPQLCLYFGFSPEPGTYKVNLELLGVKGEPVLERRPEDSEMKVEAGVTVDLVAQIAPFKLIEGTYTARLFVGRDTFERKFEVIRRVPPTKPQD